MKSKEGCAIRVCLLWARSLCYVFVVCCCCELRTNILLNGPWKCAPTLLGLSFIHNLPFMSWAYVCVVFITCNIDSKDELHHFIQGSNEIGQETGEEERMTSKVEVVVQLDKHIEILVISP